MAPQATKPCPACSGAGEKYTGFGAFKFRGVCPTCHGECLLPAGHPAFAAAVTTTVPPAIPPIES